MTQFEMIEIGPGCDLTVEFDDHTQKFIASIHYQWWLVPGWDYNQEYVEWCVRPTRMEAIHHAYELARRAGLPYV